jgi:general secretion pathway protein L
MAADRELTLSSPRAHARGLARQLGVSGFWSWWQGELAALVPAGPRAAWQRRRLRPVLAFDGQRATLWRAAVRDGRIAMVEEAAINLEGDAAEVAAAGRAVLARGAAAQGRTPVTLALPPRAVLRKQLLLPLAVEENLRQVVGYDLDRHTPFKADELYFDARVIERDPARNVVRVDLAAARKSIVDPLLRHAESWGASVNAVSAETALSSTSYQLIVVNDFIRFWRSRW